MFFFLFSAHFVDFADLTSKKANNNNTSGLYGGKLNILLSLQDLRRWSGFEFRLPTISRWYKHTHFHAGQECAGHLGALSVHHYHDFICWKGRCNWALFLWFTAFRTASTLCAAPDLIFLIRLWTLSSGETAQASRRTVESNPRNETTTSRELHINTASTMKPDSKVELYVLIKWLYWKCTAGGRGYYVK